MENKNQEPFRAVNLLNTAPYYLLNSAVRSVKATIHSVTWLKGIARSFTLTHPVLVA